MAAAGALAATNWRGTAQATQAQTTEPAIILSERHRLIAGRIADLDVDLGRSEPGGKYISVLEDRGDIVAAGRVGAELTIDKAQHAAMVSTLRCLDALRTHLGTWAAFVGSLK